MPKYMLFQYYAGGAGTNVPMAQWTPEEIEAHIAFQVALNHELKERGEFVEAQALAMPDAARFVFSDGVASPTVIDGPYPESKELLAGYRTIDVESEARAIEIAARASAAPGPGGVPIQMAIEVRLVLGAIPSDL